MIKGETYDATKELTGWDTADYDDSAWEKPDVRPGYNGVLSATLEPPIRTTEILKPIDYPQDGCQEPIFMLEQIWWAGREVVVSGKRGTGIWLSHTRC